jgi:class 3 adenylate cyclase/pimeloyl-ACP methyl ester carboxylesterase
MERQVHYCTTEDGVRIAYCVEGRGPALLFVDGWLESFALDHLRPSYQEFVRQIGQGRTLVRYDPRGVGLSQKTVEDLSLEAHVLEADDAVSLDLRAVVAAAKLEGFTLWGGVVRGVNAIAYAVSHSERISALILHDTFARAKDVYQRDILEGFAHLARVNWEMATEALAHLPGLNAPQDDAERLARVWRESTSGDVYAANVLAGFEIDLVERLPSIKCRTLVLHHLDAGVIPFALGQALAEQIPNARLVPLAGSSGQAWLSDTRSIIDSVNSFLDEDPQTRRRRPQTKKAKVTTPLRTILFTDLVGHTEMMSRLGDGRGRDVLREHERITREVLKANGGTEVKTMGDGFMASFGSVTKAVECAIALQRAFAEREGEPLNVRVGLNAGEPIEEDGDLFGATVILASRIAAKADGGEILVADTVRGLCSGKGSLFADRGDFVAKGFEEPVRISEVTWRSE